jgi:hypothetical protein
MGRKEEGGFFHVLYQHVLNSTTDFIVKYSIKLKIG